MPTDAAASPPAASPPAAPPPAAPRPADVAPAASARAVAAAVALAIALAPFEIDALGVAVAGLRVTALEAAMLLAVALELARRLAVRRWPPRAPLALALLAFALVAALAAFTAPAHQGVALRGAGRLGLGVAFAFAAGRALCGQRARWVVGAFAATTTVVVALGAFEQLAGDGLLGARAATWEQALLEAFRPKASVTAMGARRLTSTFAHANLTASWLAAATVAAGAGALMATAARGRRFAALAATLALCALAATLSRGGLGAALVALAVCALAAIAAAPAADRRRHARRAAVLGAALAAALLACVASSPALRARLLGDGALGRPALAAKLTIDGDGDGGGARALAVVARNEGWLCWRPWGRDRHRLRARCGVGDMAVDLERRVCAGEAARLTLAPPADAARCVLDMEHHGLRSFASAGGATLSWRAHGALAPALADASRRGASPSDASAPAPGAGRPALWRAALATFAARPLLGAGPDTFRLVKGDALLAAGVAAAAIDAREHANQLWLEVLADMGALGGLALLAVALAALAVGVRALREGEGRAVVAVAVVVGAGVHGLVDVTLFSYGASLPMLLALGCAAEVEMQRLAAHRLAGRRAEHR